MELQNCKTIFVWVEVQNHSWKQTASKFNMLHLLFFKLPRHHFYPLGCDIHHTLSPKKQEVRRESLTPSMTAHPGRGLWSYAALKYSIKIGVKDWQSPLKVTECFKEKNVSCWAARCGNLRRRAKRKRFLGIKYSGISWLSWGRRIGICCYWKRKLTRRIFQM